MTSNPYLLSKGKHKSAGDGRCAMEWVAYLAGEPHSDSPECVSPVLRKFCVLLNDALPGGQRQRMRPYLARSIGTAGDGLDEQRAWLCVDWLAREYAPAFLELVPGLAGRAVSLRALPPVISAGDATRALAALCAARDAARAAAGAVARAAEWAAEREVAAWAAAWAAARVAAGDAAWDAAWAAAWAAARVAAGDAAGDAAWDAAWDALAPTVRLLQDSILDPGGLLDRMLPTEPVRLPVVSEWREVCNAV